MSTKKTAKNKAKRTTRINQEIPSIFIVDVGNASFGLKTMIESVAADSPINESINDSCAVCSGEKSISVVASHTCKLKMKLDGSQEAVNFDLTGRSTNDQLPEVEPELPNTSLPAIDHRLDEMALLALKESHARIEKEGVRAFSKKEIKDLFDSL